MADEIRATSPTIRQRMSGGLQEGLEGIGIRRQNARRAAQTLAGGDSSALPFGLGIADFVPFLGTTMGLEEGAELMGEAYDSAKRGDYLDAAAGVAGAAAELIPGGYSTVKAGKNMLNKIKTIDLPKLKPIKSDSVPSGKRQSLKEWSMAGGGVPTSHAGRTDVWHKKAHNYAAGGAVKEGVKGLLQGIVKTPQKAIPIVEAPSIIIPSKTSNLKEAVRQSKGEYGARRVERAADEIPNLEQLYNQRALENVFGGDNAKALMSMSPADFEKYSVPLIGRKKPWPGTGPKKENLPTDEYVKYLASIDKFHDVPFLEINKQEQGLPLTPFISGHEGRHRNRAMVERGEKSGLVQLLPRSELREPFPRRSQEEYIDALRRELEMTGNMVTPEKIFVPDPDSLYEKAITRPTIRLPDVYAKGGKVKGVVKAGLKNLFGDAPKGVEPIIVRTPEERSVIEKFGQKQDQEAVRQKKVEKAARDSAGKSPEESAKPVKSKGPRTKVPPDFYRKMAAEQGDDAVLRAARAGQHLKPTGEGYIGAPRTVTSGQGLGAMRRGMDTDFADSVEAVRLADPERLGTWYDRAKQGIAESTEPYQLPRTLEQHGVYSAGVSPEAELGFALKHLNSRNAGDQGRAYRGAGMRNLDDAVAQDRPANMGFKIGEYADKNDPRVPNTGLFGVNDFRRAQGMGYTDPQGNPWKAGVSDTMHPFMDAETALQVDRANTAGTGGRTDWAGPHIQEVPWVYGKGQDLYSRGSGANARYGGDELEGIKQSLVDANNTARDYMYKHAASATHEQVPGASLGHVPQVLSMTPEQKLAYGREGRFDMPAPEMELNEFPQVGAGNRDAIYGALGYRQLPSREAQGLYTNSLGEVETNPMTIARPLMDFPTGGGGGRMSPDSSRVMDTAEQFRALMDAQEAGAYNLPNTMDSVKGKNAMVLDTRNLNPDPLLDPSAGVTPTAEQLSEINRILGGASESAGVDAEKLRGEMPYGPPTKSVSRKLGALDDAAGGYGVTSTNRGALIFPYNSEAGTGGLNEIMKRGGQELETVMPNAQRQKGVASTGYVPGVGKRGEYGPLSTVPYSGEATSDMLKAFSELPQGVAENLSESESVRAAIRAKALRDSKLGGTRGDIQETRRFFSEADWPKAVAMMRKGMSPAAALAALGYNIKAMAADDR
jgi:hypothetical protein